MRTLTTDHPPGLQTQRRFLQIQDWLFKVIASGLSWNNTSSLKLPLSHACSERLWNCLQRKYPCRPLLHAHLEPSVVLRSASFWSHMKNEVPSLASIPVYSSIGHHLLFLHLLYFRTLLFLDCSALVPRATQGPLLPVECQSLVSRIQTEIIPFICQPPANTSMNLFRPEAVQWLRIQMWESRLHRTGLKRSREAAQRPHCLIPEPPLPWVTSSVTPGELPHIPRSQFPLW